MQYISNRAVNGLQRLSVFYDLTQIIDLAI